MPGLSIQSSVRSLLGICFLTLVLASCQSDGGNGPLQSDTAVLAMLPPPEELPSSPVDVYYHKRSQDSLPSVSKGTPSNGSLENAWLLPFGGENWSFYDSASYLNGRAYLNGALLQVVTESYQRLAQSTPDRHWKVMDCSFRQGGQIWPHRTHRNGLSIDFMVPLTRAGAIYTERDYGLHHYMMQFDDDGALISDTEVKIDFVAMGKHLLALDDAAREKGVGITKVILKIDLQDDLKATADAGSGDLLRKSFGAGGG